MYIYIYIYVYTYTYIIPSVKEDVAVDDAPGVDVRQGLEP